MSKVMKTQAHLFLIVAGLCIAVFSSSAYAAVQVFDTQIAATSDDAEEDISGEIDLKSSDIEMVYDKGNQTAGLRFPDIAIPAGATVIDAWLQFTVDETKSVPTSLTIAAELSNNPATFNTTPFNISSRPKTSALVNWSPVGWTDVGAAGANQRTPNLAPLLNEAINSNGWTSGNALVFIVNGSGERVAEAYSRKRPQLATRLHISYETDGSGPVNTAPQVNIISPNDGTTITEGDLLSFSASANDAEEGDLSLTLSWTSSLDGTLPASGGNPSLLLSEGTHLITASSVDAGSLSGSDSVTIIVTPASGGNTPPIVTISSPADGTVIDEGDALNFTATATDSQDGNITAGLIWWSSIDGQLPASGGSANLVLSRGTHVIATSVTDSGDLSATASITVSVIPTGGTPEVLDLQISSGADDAEERSTNYVSLTSSDLEMIFDKYEQIVGMRFTNVNIDAGATVIKAWIQFTADETDSGATNLLITGDANTNAAPFISSSNNLSLRATTNAQVGWQPPPWNIVGAAGANERTSDLSPVINEIVNSSGWSRGNALALLISGSGKRVAESANGQAGAAPVLHIEYLYSGNRPPIVEAGPDASLLLPANTLALNGSVGDDGLPETGSLTSSWTHIGGTGTGQVSFGNKNASDTIVTIGSSAAGTYVLQLSASDGELTATDELTVSVDVGGTIQSISQSNYFDTGFANLSSPLAVPAIDPAGLVYHAPSGRLIIADSEINEVTSAFDIVGANLFATRLTGGTVYDQWDTTVSSGNEPSRNREPTGIAYCANDEHFYVTNDDSRYVYRYEFDGSDFTAVDAFDTDGYSNDPEGITCDPATGRLYIIGGSANNILVLSYDNGFVLEEILYLPSTAGSNAGIPDDPEGIAFDPGSNHLFVISSSDERIYEYRLNGRFVKSFDIDDFSPSTKNAQGLSIGPASDDPQQTSFYISDGMTDNDYDANERDGRIYEARINRSQ